MLHPDRESQDHVEEATQPIGRAERVQVFHDETRSDAGAKDDRSLGQLFSELMAETRTLVRDEIELAKTEVSTAAGKAVKHVAFLVVGGLLAFAGLIVLLLGLAYVLADAIDSLGLATLIVGVLTLAVAGFLAMSGLGGLKKTNFKPERTIQTLQEDKQWLKETI